MTSQVEITNLDRPGSRANGKSILEVLSLGAGPGHRIRVTVDGHDEDADLAELMTAIASGLGEGSAQAG